MPYDAAVGAAPIFDDAPSRVLTSGMPLDYLLCNRYVADLRPLAGLSKLTKLSIVGTEATDLTPLKNLKLTELHCNASKILDLSPLVGMKLKVFNCDNTQVSDLSPLQGMPLEVLRCDTTSVTDLTPLQGMKLTKLSLTPKKISKGMDVIRQMKSLQSIGIVWNEYVPTAEFWKKYDAGEFGKPDAAAIPAGLDFPVTVTPRQLVEWTLKAKCGMEVGGKEIRQLSDLPAGEFQVGRVSLGGQPWMTDDVMARIAKWQIAILDLGYTPTITDESLRHLAKSNKALSILSVHTTKVTGVGFDAFKERSIEALTVGGCPISTEGWQRIAEIGELRQLWAPGAGQAFGDDQLMLLARRQPNLKLLQLAQVILSDRGLKELGGLKQLGFLSLPQCDLRGTELTGLGQNEAVEWLELPETGISDIGLKGLSTMKKVKWMILTGCDIHDDGLKSLERTKTLAIINLKQTKVTAAGVAALQKALPDCKIDWDEPEK